MIQRPFIFFLIGLFSFSLLGVGSDKECLNGACEANKFNDDCTERPRAIWEQPVCPPCKESTGVAIARVRKLEDALVTIKPYGYIRWEAFWDTCQVVGSREDHLLFYPRRRVPDLFGEDINSHGQWHMTPVETRVGIALTGPEWDCYKTAATIEGDFRGPTVASFMSFRLRHAYGRISWDNGSFLFGQYWHPLFVPECFPATVNFSIGAPFELQARDPQLRLTQRWNCFELIVAALSQRDFQSPGPNGQSTEYIRNAVTPNLHLQLRGYFGKQLVGLAADYKRLVPRIVSDENVIVNESINSFIVEAFTALIYAPWSLRMKVFWAQNGTDHLLMSGYGVRTVNPLTDARTYSNTAAVGAWLDSSYLFCCDAMELGCLVGGTKNLGSRHKLFIDQETKRPIIFALNDDAQDIDYVVRIAPRYVYKRDPIRFGAEFEWTRASFGKPNRCGRVKNGVPVDNFRVLLALYYMF